LPAKQVQDHPTHKQARSLYSKSYFGWAVGYISQAIQMLFS